MFRLFSAAHPAAGCLSVLAVLGRLRRCLCGALQLFRLDGHHDYRRGVNPAGGGGYIHRVFLRYTIGRVLSGLACQLVSPCCMIFVGLMLSEGCNLGMAALSPALMPILWAANSLFQAMVWPPIVRLFAECIPIAQQKGACINITSTTPAGTLDSYALCAVLLAFTDWRTTFMAGALNSVYTSDMV